MEVTLRPATPGISQKLAVGAATTHSNVFGSGNSFIAAVVTVDTDTYMRMSNVAADVATTDGTDQLLLSGTQYRISPIPAGYYLHFIQKSASGSVHITPGA